MSRVLVTGGSGFLGSWCVVQLLARGHSVATTLRSRGREAEVIAMLEAGGAENAGAVEFFEADLLHDEGWAKAVEGCEYVLHVASPFGGSAPEDPKALVAAARDGSLRVLRAARDAGVKRVVLTSSLAAIGYGHPPQEAPFTEADWTDVTQPDVQPYIRSKAVGERAAWDFVAAEGGSIELSVVNPVGIFGPVLGPDYSSSIEIIRTMLSGGMPAVPRTYFGLVDVRDAADLHLRAMMSEVAAGERFIAVSGHTLSMLEVAKVLRAGLGAAAAKVPTQQLPDAVVKTMAMATPRLRQVVPQLGKIRRASNAKAHSVLGWAPRSNEEVILATARSLFDRGILPPA